MSKTPALLVAVLLAAASTADACSVALDYERSAAFAPYDDAYLAWFATLTDSLKGDADPEIAYVGHLLADLKPSFDPRPPPPPPPPPPGDTSADAASEAATVLPRATTGFSHYLRTLHCRNTGSCDDEIAAWIDAEPDNAFAILQVLAPFRRGRYADVESRLAQATRYDDYFGALRNLRARIAARPNGTPPVPPPDYELPPCFALRGLDLDTLLDRFVGVSRPAASLLLTDKAISETTRLHVADLMIAATNTLGAEVGVEVGIAAASDPVDRERYCRLKARLDAVPTTITFGADAAIRKRGFYAALETRNAIDAVEAFVRQEGGEPMRAVDEAAIAACVTRAAPAVGTSPQDLDTR